MISLVWDLLIGKYYNLADIHIALKLKPVYYTHRFIDEEPGCQYVLSSITGKMEDSESNFLDSIAYFSMGTAIIGFTVFVMSYIFVTCLNHAAENQV